jgi:ABC-type multidrug transport system ATPase subunit
VPQDDVVHGNLTVEENLWFSAQCRYQMLFEVFSQSF